MSTLIPASASGRNVRPATPGRSGTAGSSPSRRRCHGRSGDDRLLEHVLLPEIQVPSESLNEERTWIRTPWFERTRPSAVRGRAPRWRRGRASPRTRPRAACARRGRCAGRRCRRRRRRCRSRRRRRRAPRRARRPSCRSRRGRAWSRRVVGRDALEARDDRDLPRVERLVDAAARDLDDRALPCVVSVRIPACEPVNDTASWPSALIAIDTSAIEIRSPEVSSMSISRGVRLGRRPAHASAISSSVVCPIAETTAHTRLPASAVRDDPARDALDLLGPGDGVPPYFCDDARSRQLGAARRERIRPSARTG